MIQDLKDLKQLLKLCRDKGITEFKMNGLEIKFGDLPTSQASPMPESEAEMTDEELIFYSAPGTNEAMS